MRRCPAEVLSDFNVSNPVNTRENVRDAEKTTQMELALKEAWKHSCVLRFWAVSHIYCYVLHKGSTTIYVIFVFKEAYYHLKPKQTNNFRHLSTIRFWTNWHKPCMITAVQCLAAMFWSNWDFYSLHWREKADSAAQLRNQDLNEELNSKGSNASGIIDWKCAFIVTLQHIQAV